MATNASLTQSFFQTPKISVLDLFFTDNQIDFAQKMTAIGFLLKTSKISNTK